MSYPKFDEYCKQSLEGCEAVKEMMLAVEPDWQSINNRIDGMNEASMASLIEAAAAFSNQKEGTAKQIGYSIRAIRDTTFGKLSVMHTETTRNGVSVIFLSRNKKLQSELHSKLEFSIRDDASLCINLDGFVHVFAVGAIDHNEATAIKLAESLRTRTRVIFEANTQENNYPLWARIFCCV